VDARNWLTKIAGNGEGSPCAHASPRPHGRVDLVGGRRRTTAAGRGDRALVP
jgi:hypothetical protein